MTTVIHAESLSKRYRRGQAPSLLLLASSSAAALVLLGGLFFFNRMESTVADRV